MLRLIALTLLLLVVPAAAASARPAVTVMTRDVYVGGDVRAPFEAIEGKSDREALVAFGNAAYALREDVDATDPIGRAALIAAEVIRREPDLVGLQDVALWRRGPLDYSDPGEPGVKDVDIDFLQLLLDQLGGTYEAVRVEREADIELPAFPGDDVNDPNGFNARLTTYDVILERVDSPVRVVRTGSKSYARKVTAGVYDFASGYAWADFKLGGRTMRFVTTALEPTSNRVALAQFEQLLDGPVRAARNHPTILVCGCQSDPEDDSRHDADLPGRSVYRRATQVFRDQWLPFADPEAGYTASFSAALDDADTAPIDRRTDFVFGRRPGGHRVSTVNGWIVGTDPLMWTGSGLWPSDHAGVVVRLRP